MVVTDVTAAEAVLCVMGPAARTLLQKVSPNDFSNGKNPFGTWQEIEIGMGLARAHRVTYVGELGWELYVSTDQAAHVFEAIEEAGRDLGLKLCGLHTLDSCRIEKGFRHFGQVFFPLARWRRHAEVGQTIPIIIKGILRLLDKGIRRTVNGSDRKKGE